MFEWAVVATVLLVQAGDDRVASRLEAESELDPSHGPERVIVKCGDADASAQAAADAVIARMDLDLPHPEGFANYQLTDELIMVGGADGWAAAPGQMLIYVEPAFPMRAAQYGATHMLCAVAVRPTLNGIVDDAPVECVSDVRRAERFMERATRDVVGGWRLAPTDLNYCMD